MGRLIVLNGFPGSGKYTVLKRVAQLLPPGQTRLVDNHLLIDPVAALLPERTPDHYALRKAIREPLFTAIRALLERQCVTVLMTACLGQGSDIDRKVFEEHVEIVRGLDTDLHWITVHCSTNAMKERLADPSRYREQKTKLRDWALLEAMVGNHSLLIPTTEVDDVRLLADSIDLSGDIDNSAENIVRTIATKS